jgi:C-terminal processing protease CtpA/Prc
MADLEQKCPDRAKRIKEKRDRRSIHIEKTLDDLEITLDGLGEDLEQKLEGLTELDIEGKGNKIIRVDKEYTWLGVMTSNVQEGGARIDEVVKGSPAEIAGLQEGDVLLRVDGSSVDGPDGLSKLIRAHKSGDQVQIVYSRGAEQRSVNATLASKKTTNVVRSFRFNQNDFPGTFWKEERPCVFMGVYTATNGRKEGVRINGVIEDTPAQRAALRAGDVILAFDNVSVSGHQELTTERNKHQPGDLVTLRVKRGDQEMDIQIKLDYCPDSKAENRTQPTLDNTLNLEGFEMFPNPADRQVTVRFKGEEGPVTVRLFDNTGRQIWKDRRQDFNGTYDYTIDLSDYPSGQLLLQVMQGEKVFSKQLLRQGETQF